MAKGKKTGGRQKGTPNKDRAPVNALAERLGIDPLEVILRVVKGDWKGLGYTKPTRTKVNQFGQEFEVELIPIEMRVAAAMDAAQYLYPKRKAVELSNDSDEGFKIVLEDYRTKK